MKINSYAYFSLTNNKLVIINIILEMKSIELLRFFTLNKTRKRIATIKTILYLFFLKTFRIFKI